MQRFVSVILIWSWLFAQREPEIRRRYENFPGLRIFSGLVPYSELESLYREADIYWYPAHCLMSISMLEAMNYGLPVVTTDYYDNPEYVEDGRTGMIIRTTRIFRHGILRRGKCARPWQSPTLTS